MVPLVVDLKIKKCYMRHVSLVLLEHRKQGAEAALASLKVTETGSKREKKEKYNFLSFLQLDYLPFVPCYKQSLTNAMNVALR